MPNALTVAQVFAYQMCSEEAVDSHRFRDIIDAAIARGDATATKPYRAWTARVAKRSAPKNPLAWPPKEGPSGSKSSTEDLALAIKYAQCCCYTSILIAV